LRAFFTSREFPPFPMCSHDFCWYICWYLSPACDNVPTCLSQISSQTFQSKKVFLPTGLTSFPMAGACSCWCWREIFFNVPRTPYFCVRREAPGQESSRPGYRR